MVQSKLSEEDMKDTDLVRAKVHDMAKLGEMKWRYRVVDEGQSPRDEAIHILTEARPTRTTQHPPPSSPRPPPLDLTRPNSRPPRVAAPSLSARPACSRSLTAGCHLLLDWPGRPKSWSTTT